MPSIVTDDKLSLELGSLFENQVSKGLLQVIRQFGLGREILLTTVLDTSCKPPLGEIQKIFLFQEAVPLQKSQSVDYDFSLGC